jgi:hypothetical protein
MWEFDLTMKCSFCERPLTCKACGQDYQPRNAQTHLATYQPDMEVICPACQALLVCKWCGFVYGDPDENEADENSAGWE